MSADTRKYMGTLILETRLDARGLVRQDGSVPLVLPAGFVCSPHLACAYSPQMTKWIICLAHASDRDMIMNVALTYLNGSATVGSEAVMRLVAVYPEKGNLWALTEDGVGFHTRHKERASLTANYSHVVPNKL